MPRSRRLAPPAPALSAAMSARKSAPVSAGGVNVRRLMLSREAEHKREEEEEEEKEEEEEEEKEPNNECGSPFCRQMLGNRYARFCEDKPMCQRYRALQLQCRANAQAEEDEEDTRPLSHVLKRRKKCEEKEKETFAIPRRKKAEGAPGKRRRLNLSAERDERGGSPRLKEQKQKKREEERQLEEEKRQARRAAAPSRSPSVASSASSSEELGSRVQRAKKRLLPRARQPSEASSDAEAGAVDVPRVKTRRLNRRVSADDVLSRSASSSPVSAASDANWKIPRAKPARPTTAVQAIKKKMNVELVPLGFANQANFTGGGRYVQNGNRSAAQSIRPSDPRPRPLNMTKFTSPPVSALASASSRPLPTVPPPAVPHRQQQLPPLPPQASWMSPPVPRPTGPTRSTTPVSSPGKKSAGVSSATTRSNAPAAGTPGVQRISTADYLRSRKGDSERRPQGEREDHPPSRSSSLERSTSSPGDRAAGFPPASVYPTGSAGHHRSDSAPLPSYRESRPPLDPRRQHPEADARHQRPYSDTDGTRMEYRDRLEGRGEPLFNDRSTSGKWEPRNVSPPRDRYLPRQQELSSFGTGNGGYDYPAGTHYSPASSPAEQLFRREPPRDEPPPPQRAPSPRRSELERVNSDRETSDHDELDTDAPTFSYHEEFLPRLLSVFIHKLPQSLEAVFNVTKKPRKMNWYIKYVERIERLCKPFDLQIKFEGLKAMVTVRGREWLTLQGTSTVTLHLEIIKSLRAEAMTWLRLYEEMENAFAHYRGMYGNKTNESYTFLRAWNLLKSPGNYISLSRQTNYFCGARLHHWNFVVGNIEIGSGSHEEKRESFRLATVSALDFLLSIGRGMRRPSREIKVKLERALESDRPSSRGSHRSSSRESSASNRARAPPAHPQANGTSTEIPSSSTAPPSSFAAEPSDIEPPSFTEQPSADEPTTSTDPLPVSGAPPTTQLQTYPEPSSSPVTVERKEKRVVAIIPTTNSNNSSREVEEMAEQSDPGEEMSISDASDLGTLTPAGSPRLSTNSPSAVAEPATSATPVVASPPASKGAASTSVDTENPSTVSIPSTVPVGGKLPNVKAVGISAPVSVSSAAVGDGGSTSNKDTPASQAKANATIPPRRCMMCEMIRMRKPNGERCLLCQQKDAPANGLPLGP
ncbi:hypothetical protein PHYPSEUDO_010073 [Phytophthora pseudosyringae]|uniref:Uncharacterized protein n=1 Tax=Phytophthora pseudosyringae TaxID=221518 RepID=A0A8T1VC08_9STRA|nr:hypothetical protein PHYPSEUDO_010073 [Phytophthora pseudosyringae]